MSEAVERDKLLALLQELVDTSPYVPGEMSGSFQCLFCFAFKHEEHSTDCLWRRAKEAIK